MAYSGQTTHYGLPKYVSTDKPSWLDTNDAFDTIDAAIYAAATAVDPSTITTMQNDITALQSGKQDVLTFDAAPASGSVNPVTSGGVYTAVNNVSIALGVTDLKVSTLEGAMGNTDISAIGDGTVTGAISALSQNVGESVQVTADGVKSYGTLLNELFALIDGTKINKDSVIEATLSSIKYIYKIAVYESGRYTFSYFTSYTSGMNAATMTLRSGTSGYFADNFDGTNWAHVTSTTNIATNGDVLKVIY